MEATQPLCVGSASLIAGRYRLGLMIGRGATAEVFRARDELLGRDVAIKVFHQTCTTDQDEARRQSEIAILAGMNHRGLVTIYDAGTDESQPTNPRPFVVLELINGDTLSRRLTYGRLRSTEVAALGAQLADALGYIHSRGVIHRDVKPANVLLPSGDRSMAEARLADFGIAQQSNATRMTAVGLTIGTANYLSPEQVTGGPLTPASDMYSFGLVLIECLSGRQVYPGHGIQAALARLHCDPAIPPHVGRSWAGLLTALTQRDPTQRPRAIEVHDKLRHLAEGESGEYDPTELLGPLSGIAWQTPPAHAAPVGRRQPLLKIAAGLSVLGAAVIVSLATTSGSGGSPAPATAPGAAGTSQAPAASSSPASEPDPTALVSAVITPSGGTAVATPSASAKIHGKGKRGGGDNG